MKKILDFCFVSFGMFLFSILIKFIFNDSFLNSKLFL